MNVAQLKLRLMEVERMPEKKFPRLNERGSIEATPSTSLGPRPPTFPRLNERGSIEARSSASYRPLHSVFPRLNERGSIEALGYY